jgi:hypothetical protein
MGRSDRCKAENKGEGGTKAPDILQQQRPLRKSANDVDPFVPAEFLKLNRARPDRRLCEPVSEPSLVV